MNPYLIHKLSNQSSAAPPGYRHYDTDAELLTKGRKWRALMYDGRVHIRNLRTGDVYLANTQEHDPEKMAIRENHIGVWTDGKVILDKPPAAPPPSRVPSRAPSPPPSPKKPEPPAGPSKATQTAYAQRTNKLKRESDIDISNAKKMTEYIQSKYSNAGTQRNYFSALAFETKGTPAGEHYRQEVLKLKS